MTNTNCLIGKTIKSIDVTGSWVEIVFTDETKFHYEATDGGYSGWDIEISGKGCKNCAHAKQSVGFLFCKQCDEHSEWEADE